MRTVWSRWGRSLALLAVSSFIISSLCAPVFAQSSVKRQVLGTLHSHNKIEIAESTGEWKTPKPGAALVENTFIRAGDDGAGLVDLGQNGVLGLYPGGRLFLGTIIGGTLPVGLEAGEIAFRLPKTSKIELRTASAIVKPSGVIGVGTGNGFLEGFLSITEGGKTAVRVQNGSVMVRGIEGTDFTPIKAGQEAQIGAGDVKPRVVTVAATSMGNDPAGRQEDRSEQPPAKRRRGVPYVFSRNSELAALVGGVGIVGGTVGGLAATGTFDGNDNEGSEFEKK